MLPQPGDRHLIANDFSTFSADGSALGLVDLGLFLASFVDFTPLFLGMDGWGERATDSTVIIIYDNDISLSYHIGSGQSLVCY